MVRKVHVGISDIPLLTNRRIRQSQTPYRPGNPAAETTRPDFALLLSGREHHPLPYGQRRLQTRTPLRPGSPAGSALLTSGCISFRHPSTRIARYLTTRIAIRAKSRCQELNPPSFATTTHPPKTRHQHPNQPHIPRRHQTQTARLPNDSAGLHY